jgi:hypothetical protein
MTNTSEGTSFVSIAVSTFAEYSWNRGRDTGFLKVVVKVNYTCAPQKGIDGAEV